MQGPNIEPISSAILRRFQCEVQWKEIFFLCTSFSLCENIRSHAFLCPDKDSVLYLSS